MFSSCPLPFYVFISGLIIRPKFTAVSLFSDIFQTLKINIYIATKCPYMSSFFNLFDGRRRGPDYKYEVHPGLERGFYIKTPFYKTHLLKKITVSWALLYMCSPPSRPVLIC